MNFFVILFFRTLDMLPSTPSPTTLIKQEPSFVLTEDEDVRNEDEVKSEEQVERDNEEDIFDLRSRAPRSATKS